MSRLTVSISAALYVVFLVWVGGGDFERGTFSAICTAAFAPMVSLFVWFYPGWSDK